MPEDFLPTKDDVLRLERLLDQYTIGLKARSNTVGLDPNQDSEGTQVVLTGSTGSLGSYLLNQLLSCSNIKKIYCLNRSLDGHGRQLQAMRERKLCEKWDKNRVIFLHADLSKPDFGLGEDSYQVLSENVTHFIRTWKIEVLDNFSSEYSIVDFKLDNAWPVDLISGLDKFLSHIQGVRNIVDFCVQSTKNSHVSFISSIAVASYYAILHPASKVPERAMDNLAVAETGYGQSKLLSELVMAKAAEACGTQVTVYRLPHIAGPIVLDGIWNRSEWIPTMIASSKIMGVMPRNLPYLNKIDWIPVDVLSNILVELIRPARQYPGSQVSLTGSCDFYHIVNTQQESWTDLVPAVKSTLSGPSLKLIPFDQWFDILMDAAACGQTAQTLPVLKLLGFFENITNVENAGFELAEFDTTRARTDSVTMAGLMPITRAHIETWVKQWNI